MRKKEDNGNSKAARLATGILLGGGAAFVFSLAVLAVLAALVTGGTVGEKNLYQLSLAICALSGFIGGRIAVKRAGGCALPVGMGAGLLAAALLAAAGFLCMETLELGRGTLLVLLCGLAGGGLAGLLNGNKKKKKRK